MKNLSLLIIGIIIGALGTYYFCPNSPEDEVLLGSAVKPSGVITAAEAKALDMAFDSRHQLISDSIVNKPDNRSAWWSLEDIQNYLEYAEDQSSELGYKMDGIRLYLGAYPNTAKGTVGYTTMFFVPTGERVVAEGSSAPFKLKRKGGDVPGGDGLNMGGLGEPPSINYPQ
ncbi:hypothetical protein ACW5R3_08645 [Bizionia sp. KMM 8389]